ncbi:MAG TPA: hypothetical protein VN632_02300 [Stellaceae bacterium]|nr:hypothetical protein [Stellaceae bacterium]
MRRSFRFLLMPLLLTLLVAACQPLPHPFEEETISKPQKNAPILSPPDAVGVVVGPVAGAPGPAAAALAGAMAEALMKDDVPADTEAGNQHSYRLKAAVTTRPGGDRVRVDIQWTLAAADGRAVGTETVSAEVPAASWQRGDSDIAKALVARSAPTLARRVEGDAPREKAVGAATVGVVPVTGATGDGGQSLSLAMAAALHRAGVALQEKPGDKPAFILAGKVDIGPPQGGHQNVKIVWALSRVDGRDIGQVSQENAVPAGSLDGKWGDTAYDVALAAVGGIVELLQKAQQVGS